MLQAKNEIAKKEGVGIIIGRFQVPALHQGHLQIIESVLERHDSAIIILGVAPIRSTKNNPLDVESRRLMIQEIFPKIKVLYLFDMPTNEQWSKNLDKIIEHNIPPAAKVTLYGSRDSFIKSYSGRYQTKELVPETIISGTRERELASYETKGTEDFRRGVVYGIQNQYDCIHPTVDIAVLKKDSNKVTHVLFGLKKQDEGLIRFLGGFVQDSDIEEDFYEKNAIREVSEEATNIEIGNLKYIGTYKINDWRYRCEKNKIVTTFYMADLLFGNPIPGDDIDELRWIPIEKMFDENFSNQIVPEHQILFRVLKNSFI